MSSLPPLPASQHGMIMTLPPGSVGPDGALRSAESSLPMGTRLGEFEIVELIGEGGFGIVYLATDHLLGRQVALKEYMPSALASRGAHGQVGVKSERHAETFEAGRRSFVNEARLLAQFDHPALVKVFRFWEGNGTAYMVMPFYRGRTLRQALAEMGTPPTQAWLAQMLSPLLDALETLHVAQCYHRDIAPDNILLLDNGQPVLLDFGAARRVIGDITQALTVILKPGFAPVEQYANGPEMKQGPWTDVYALAAVIYYCATLKAPVPSVSRMIKDTLVPFATVAGDRYDAAFCAAVDHGLAVAVEARPQDIGAFRDSLGLPAGQPIPTVFGATAFGPPPAGPGRGVIDSDDLFAGIGRPAADLESTVVDPAALRRGRTGADVFGSGSAASGRSGSAGSQPMGSGAPFGAAAPTGRPPPNPPPAAPWTPDADVQMQRLGATPEAGGETGRRWLPIAAAVVVVAAIALGVWFWTQSSAPPPVAQAPSGAPVPPTSGPASPASSPAAPPAASPAPGPLPQAPAGGAFGAGTAAPIPAPSALPALPAQATPPAPVTIPSLVPMPVPPAGPAADGGGVPAAADTGADGFSVARLIDSLHQQRSADWAVSVRVGSERVRIGKDPLTFRLRSDRDGYVYLLLQGTDRAHFYQLFPNGLDRNNRIRANVDMALPRSNWEMIAGGPAGVNRLIALVTPSPRNFTAAGLNTGQPFSEFDLQTAGRVFADKGSIPFAGEPVGCRLDAAACSAYGAALFEIEEY